MKALKTIALLATVLCFSYCLHAQETDSSVSSRALLFAGKINNAYNTANWNEYVSMSYPGIVNYYGGTRDFREFSERARTSVNATSETVNLSVLQLVREGSEWQCVVEKSQQSMVEGNKAVIISYMVGQSKDNGNTWMYFDVSYNSPQNLDFIMPDIFGRLEVPQRRIIFAKNEIVTRQ